MRSPDIAYTSITYYDKDYKEIKHKVLKERAGEACGVVKLGTMKAWKNPTKKEMKRLGKNYVERH
jgi:hypothetical protein